MANRPVAPVKAATPAPPAPRPPLTSAEIRAKYKKVVRVPRPPKRAYNPNRPVSGLVENQIRHLQSAEWKLQPAHRSRIAAQTITTERQASAYIQHVTSKLHPEGAPVSATARVGSRKRRSIKKASGQKRKSRKTARVAARRRR